MRKTLDINNIDIAKFKKHLLNWGNNFSRFVFFDSHDFIKKNKPNTYYEYDFLAAVNVIQETKAVKQNNFNQLSKLINKNDWLFGYLSYDLKNEIENLKSENIDNIDLPLLHFFIPEFVFTYKKENLQIHYLENLYTEKEIHELVNSIVNYKINENNSSHNKVNIESRFSKEDYIDKVNKLKNHIQLGDIYEINFCQEFYCRTDINPLHIYKELNKVSPTPFSCYFKLDNKYLISASPERYLKKIGNKVISQPIKGTIKRSENLIEDEKLKENLYSDPKERAENVMIVDLVRNDLSKTAKKCSVKVEELFGIYSFSQVHQMISTVSSEVDPSTEITDILKTTFPMGSMTGAPKIRAMKLIEKYEKTKRGLYSGAVGYITPDKNFDFNVVIRSILYNESKKYVSFTVGGAITSLAIPEKEYDECIIKAKAITEVLS